MALAARSVVLQSVFPSVSDAQTSVTPQATPVLTQESFGHSQGNDVLEAAEAGDTASESVRWERSWHTATSFLTDKVQGLNTSASPQTYPKEVRVAIHYLASPDSVGWKLRKTSKVDDLLWWYSQAVQEQLLRRHGPSLRKLCLQLSEDPSSWLELRSRLSTCRAILLGPVESIVLPIITDDVERQMRLFDSSYRAIITQLLMDRTREPLVRFLRKQAQSALENVETEDLLDEESMHGIETTAQQEAQALLEGLLLDLVRGGFPADSLESLLARALSSTLKTHVVNSCTGRWTSPSPISDELKEWISGPFASLARGCLKSIRASTHISSQGSQEITKSDLSTWTQTAFRELGLLRLRELFEIIVDWDNDTKGGIEDLKRFITTPQARMHVVSHFNDVLSYRLLHPGAATAEILQIYVRIMRAFAVLDPRFVILDRVSRPIRRYLRDRDDTIKIIMTGLLSDPDEAQSTAHALVEVAVELHLMDEFVDQDEGGEWDWDDMSWVPNPADAEADYKSSKGLDIIGNLLTLFESKDTVVREFQNILGERLLSPESDFSREIHVLELLKSRFGEAAMQGCEVMIKDIFDSIRTGLLIKKEQDTGQIVYEQPDFYAKILSRFFWPSLRDDDFHIPTKIKALQENYSRGFEEHKMQRKLAWLPSLGQVTVELQLEDRTISELVTTWQASVIYSFNEVEDGQSPDKTVQDLVESLNMDEDLVSNALTFWVSKLVLYQPQPGIYRVLETLPSEEAIDSTADEQDASANIVAAAHNATAAAAASAASAVRSEEELAEEKMELMWQYVVGMLTNQGSMPLQQMVMMLNFVVPGGFAHSQEEFRKFLLKKVEGGKLHMAGANFKMPKK